MATAISTRFGSNDKVALVSYRLRAAGGTWNPTDNGIYRVSMYRSRVKDISGNLVRRGSLGYFGNGVLRFDRDGTGGEAAVAIATFTGNLALSVNQISIVA